MWAREIVKLPEGDGWTKERQKGSHAAYRDPKKPGLIVVLMHVGADLGRGLAATVLTTAGLTRRQ